MPIAKSELVVAAMLTLAASAGAHASDLRGDNFITAMDGNTLSGGRSDGSEFNVYFLPGGSATYSTHAGEHDSGTWRLDREGDVCIKWQKGAHPLEGCFRVSFDRDRVSWRNKDGTTRAELRGDVTETFLRLPR